MPTNKIARTPNAAMQTPVPAGVVRVAVDSNDGRIYVNRGNSVGREPITPTTVRAITASATLTAADDGAVIIADSTTSVVMTLPATAKGLKFTLIVGQLTTSGGHAFSPAAADKIMGNGFTAADDKDAICSAATDRVGDAITLVGDGVDGWYITSVTGTWARE